MKSSKRVNSMAGLAIFGLCFSVWGAPAPQVVLDAMRENRWGQAKEMLVETLKERPGSAKAWYYLAVTEARLGNLNEAKIDFAKAKELQPGIETVNPKLTQMLEKLLEARELSQETQQTAWAAARQEPVGRVGSPGGAVTATPLAVSSYAPLLAMGAVAGLVGVVGAYLYSKLGQRFRSKR